MKQKAMKSPRPPSGVPRRDRALATRRRILEAAYQLVCEQGYEATTMAAIAERAGVAVQTLYFTFHTKPAILTEVLHASVVGIARWTPSLDREVKADHRSVARDAMPWFRPFEAEPDPRKALAIFVAGTAAIHARVGPLLMKVGAASEIEATLAESNRLREEASQMLVAELASKGKGLRASLSRRQAVDVFFVLTRAELYHDLRVGRGWSDAKAQRWLVDVLAHQLLAE